MCDDNTDAVENAGTPPGGTSDAVLLRLLVGGGLEARDVLERWIARATAPAVPAASDAAVTLEIRARRVLLGVLFESYDRVAASTAATARLAGGAVSLGTALVAPIRRSRLLAPLRWPFEIGATMGLTLLERWERLGTIEEQRSRRVVRGAATLPVDEILTHLQKDPAMQVLVLQQAEALLAELPQSPQVNTLVRTQADRYVEHLHDNPETVRELISGQSVGLVTEVLNSLRYQAYRFDAVLERVVRTVFGRKPREELPLPPPAVQHRAEHPHDYVAG